MFERFTDRSRRVVVMAQEESRRAGHDYIGTEHILLGLLVVDQGIGGRVLNEAGLTLDAARDAVAHLAPPSEGERKGHVPFTPQAKGVLERSLRHALRLGHNYIGTEHQLLGLIEDVESIAVQVIVGAGIDLVDLRTRTVEMLSGLRRVSGLREGAVVREAASRQTPAGSRVMAQAEGLAGPDAVGTHHLLKVILSDPKSAAARALVHLGIDLEAATDAIDELGIEGTSDEAAEAAGARTTMMRIDGDRVIAEVTNAAWTDLIRKAGGEGTLRGDDPTAEGFDKLWTAMRQATLSMLKQASPGAFGLDLPDEDETGSPDEPAGDETEEG